MIYRDLKRLPQISDGNLGKQTLNSFQPNTMSLRLPRQQKVESLLGNIASENALQN